MIDPLAPWSPAHLRYFGTGFAMVGCAIMFVHAFEQHPLIDSSRAVWLLAAVVFGYAWQDTPVVLAVTAVGSTLLAVVVPLAVLGRVFLLLVKEDT